MQKATTNWSQYQDYIALLTFIANVSPVNDSCYTKTIFIKYICNIFALFRMNNNG